MMFSRNVLLSLLAGSLPLLRAASLQRITTSFGANPTNVGFYIFVPDQLATRPPILVNPHWCHGDANAAYSGSQYATLAGKYGFIVIYPDSPNLSDHCWDVSSSQTLTHNGGGDSLGIVNMVKWTIDKYKGDPSRIFVTGVSSGAMMTNVLVGAYPDIFAGGSAFAGVAFGCFAAGINNTSNYDYWNDQCATGKVTHTPEAWKAIVQSALPGYSGWRPKMQVFHGTADEVLNYVNFGEEVKQWTAVLGLNQAPVVTTQDSPVTGWTEYNYDNSSWFEAYSAAGVSHNIQVQENTVMNFFDLTCVSGPCFHWGQGGSSTSSSSTAGDPTASSVSKTSRAMLTTTIRTSHSVTPTSSTATAVPLYGQWLVILPSLHTDTADATLPAEELGMMDSKPVNREHAPLTIPITHR